MQSELHVVSVVGLGLFRLFMLSEHFYLRSSYGCVKPISFRLSHCNSLNIFFVYTC